MGCLEGILRTNSDILGPSGRHAGGMWVISGRLGGTYDDIWAILAPSSAVMGGISVSSGPSWGVLIAFSTSFGLS